MNIRLLVAALSATACGLPLFQAQAMAACQDQSSSAVALCRQQSDEAAMGNEKNKCIRYASDGKTSPKERADTDLCQGFYKDQDRCIQGVKDGALACDQELQVAIDKTKSEKDPAQKSQAVKQVANIRDTITSFKDQVVNAYKGDGIYPEQGSFLMMQYYIPKGQGEQDIMSQGNLKANLDMANSIAPQQTGSPAPPKTPDSGPSKTYTAAQAQQVFGKQLKANPKNEDALTGAAQAALALGDAAAARAHARKALQVNPNNELARAILGTDGAIERAAAALNLDRLRRPFDTKAGASIGGGAGGAVFVGGGKFDPAAALSTARWGQLRPMPQEQLTLTPSNVLIQEALDKGQAGDLAGALLAATRAIQSDQADPKAWGMRAAVSNRLQRYDAAVSDATRALRLDPKYAPALLERAFALQNLGDYSAALEDADQALKLEPANALAHYYRGMALEKLSRRSDALAEFQKAAQSDAAFKYFSDDAQARSAARQAAWTRRFRLLGGLGAAILLLLLAELWMRRRATQRVAADEAATLAQTSPPTGAQSPGTLAPGSLLAGAYRIERELGKGGMGVVYQAMDMKLQRPVALKHLRREGFDSPELRERFLKEARLVAKLRHPNLAEIFTVVGDEDLYLVFELMPGEALDKTIAKRGRLSLEEAKRIVGEICGALQYAHNEHVIHRDLKPANVMFDKDGKAKVMDFGIAHEVRGAWDMTQTAAWGTPPYMAPEQEQGRVGKESDLYALAVMAYEMLTGARPFVGPYFLEKKLKKEFPPATAINGQLPKSADDFFAKALDPDPEKRFRSAPEFSQAFQSLS